MGKPEKDFTRMLVRETTPRSSHFGEDDFHKANMIPPRSAGTGRTVRKKQWIF
jgi:hypothetical protein